MTRGPESVFRHHWRAFFSGGLLSLTRLITGFVRVKYVALMLGTAGVGFLSQANELQILGISIASLSMAVGIINRMGAIGPDNRARVLSAAGNALLIGWTPNSPNSGELVGIGGNSFTTLNALNKPSRYSRIRYMSCVINMAA